MMMLLTAAVSVETVLHRLQPKPTATLCTPQQLALVHHVQKIDREAQTQTFEASYSRLW